MLSWLRSEVYHGIQAKSHLVRNSENTVEYFRDFIGKKYSKIDSTNSHNSAHPMDIDAISQPPACNEETVSTVSINKITTRHISRPRDSKSNFLGCKVTGAVITVPTEFSNTQKEALVATAKAGSLRFCRSSTNRWQLSLRMLQGRPPEGRALTRIFSCPISGVHQVPGV